VPRHTRRRPSSAARRALSRVRNAYAVRQRPADMDGAAQLFFVAPPPHAAAFAYSPAGTGLPLEADGDEGALLEAIAIARRCRVSALRQRVFRGSSCADAKRALRLQAPPARPCRWR
jgi:hypothetical protein